MDKRNDYNNEEIYKKEINLSEEEIEGYEACMNRTQKCLTDCVWPFDGTFLSGID